MANPKVKIDVTADGTGFNRTMAGVKGTIDNLKKMAGGGGAGGLFGSLAGGAAMGAGMFAGSEVAKKAAEFIYEATIETVKFGHAIAEMAEHFNITTTEAQQLSFAAELAGKDMGFMETMMNKVDKFAEKSLKTGTKEYALRQKLGITDAEAEQMPIVQLTRLVAEKLKKAGSITDADLVFGKNQGREMMNIPEKMERSEKYGLTLSPRAIALLNDEWERMTLLMHNVWTVVKMVSTGLLVLWRVLYTLFGSIVYWVEGKLFKLLGWITGSEKLKEWGAKTDLGPGEFMARLREAVKADTSNDETAKAMEKADRKTPTTKETKLGEVGGHNQFLRIGGLMGVDTNFRLLRGIEQIVNNTAIIANNTRYNANVHMPERRPNFALSQPPAPPPVPNARTNRGGQTYSGTPIPTARAKAAGAGLPTMTFGM